MTYAFARVEAVLKMRAEDVFIQEPRTWAPLHEKGGKHRETACHHKLETCLQDYAAALGDAGIETKIGSHSFRASETDPEPGFMARWPMLCTLPRSNPGSREKYVRRNGPYTLAMTAGHPHKLPFGNIPRLLAAWVCTEAVRTQSRDLVLGHSLSGFMRKLDIEAQSGGRGGVRTRLRNQMQRFFNAQVRVVYQAEGDEASVRSPITSRTDLWWNERHPDEPVLLESTIRRGEEFSQEIMRREK